MNNYISTISKILHESHTEFDTISPNSPNIALEFFKCCYESDESEEDFENLREAYLFTSAGAPLGINMVSIAMMIEASLVEIEGEELGDVDFAIYVEALFTLVIAMRKWRTEV